MANYDVPASPEFSTSVRKFETTDQAHADVFNETVQSVFENTVANHTSIENLENPEFSKASTLAELTSKESNATLLGKIAKGIADLISHLGDTDNPHKVTASQAGAVRQGGGTGQGTNAVYIGWDGTSLTLKATVDDTDLGAFLFTGGSDQAVLPVSKGGTGATTAEEALSALGAARDGHSHLANDLYDGEFVIPLTISSSILASFGLNVATARNTRASITDITAGSSSLSTGCIYLCYE